MIEILKCENKDYTNWATLRNKLWPGLNIKGHLENIEYLKSMMSYECWLAKTNDNFVGFIEASIRAFANGCSVTPVVFLEGIWIAPEHRGSGISKKLLEFVEAWAKQNDINEIGSDTELDNLGGQKFHLNNSFKETERVIYFCKKLDDKKANQENL